MTPGILTKAQGTSQGPVQEPQEYRSTAEGETTDVFSRSVVLALRNGPANWLLPATESLIRLLTLPENWDSYGAAQVSRNSVAAARLILEKLSWFDTIAPPAISAEPDGNVAFAWSLPRCSLDVEVLPDGTIEYVYLDLANPGNELEDITSDPQVLAALLTRWKALHGNGKQRMTQELQIREDDILLRRIPPDMKGVKSTVALHEGSGRRATSARLKPRRGETGTSCSLLRITSPKRLIELGDIPNCEVCRLRVTDLLNLGFKVTHVPTEKDPGHFEFHVPEASKLGKKVYSKLAERSRILTSEEVDTGHVEST